MDHSCSHGLGISATTTGARSGYPLTPPTTAGEIRWIPGDYRSFLTQCQIIFSLQPSSFPTDADRVAYIVTQLTGKAKKWGAEAWSAELPCTQSSRHFMQEMCRLFVRSMMGHEATREILRLWQGSISISDYAIEFQTMVTDSGWEGHALVDLFLHGLSEQIKDELLTRELPEDLDQIIVLAIRIDSRLEDRRRYSRQCSLPRYSQNHRWPSPTLLHLLHHSLPRESLDPSWKPWWWIDPSSRRRNVRWTGHICTVEGQDTLPRTAR